MQGISNTTLRKRSRAMNSLLTITMLLAAMAWSVTARAQVLYGSLTGRCNRPNRRRSAGSEGRCPGNK